MRRDPSADQRLRAQVIGKRRQDPSDPSGKEDAEVVSAAEAEGGLRASTGRVLSGTGLGGHATANRTTPSDPSGKGDQNGRFGDRGGSGKVFGPSRSRQLPSGRGWEAFARRSGIEASLCLRAKGARPQKLRRKRQRMGRLRAFRPGTHLRERVRPCLERSSAASRGGRRRLDPSGTGRAGAGTSSDALASAAPVSDQAFGQGLGGGASAPLSWSHPSPDGYYQRTHTRCPTTDLKTSVIGTSGRQRRRPRSLPVDVGSPRHWFRSAPYPVRNCDRENTCPRTGTEAIATAAVKTGIFGCRREQSHLWRPKPASSDKG